jgi:hypothetical protein
MKSKMYKDAGIRNAYKKKPFFDGQVEKFNSGMITRIETPNTNFGENYIPDNKENGRQDYGRKNSFPPFDIPHPAFKTIEKRDEKGRNI